MAVREQRTGARNKRGRIDAKARELGEKAKTKFKEALMSPYQAFQHFVYWVGATVIFLFSVLAVATYVFLDSLPPISSMDFADLKRTAQERVQFRRENKKLKHYWMPMRKISRDLLYAIVASEDGEYFEHEGVNYDALLVSMATNLKQGEYSYGGSTISQQVVKNLFLSNEKTITRKLKEFLITQSLESRFGKNQILEIYLNVAEFGPDLFGVAEAAGHYFGKRPTDINAAEGAFLALMLPSPRRNHYAIFLNKNLTKSRRRKIRRILQDMLYNEFISLKQYNAYMRYDFFKHRRSQGRTLARKRGKRGSRRKK